MNRSISVPVRLFVAACLVLTAAGAQAQGWTDKVDSWVVDSAARDGETEFIVFLTEQADLSVAKSLSSKSAKGWYVYETLSKLAERTQAPILADLASAGVEHRSYWVANMIWVKGGMNVVERMARRADVGRISANPTVKMDFPEPEAVPSVNFPGVGPGIANTEAPDVFWNNGVFGQGVVIGGQDTGYDWDHPALLRTYRGWDVVKGTTHDYNWHDSIHSGGGVCGANSPEPCDDGSHGTHTMGTMVGFDGGTNWIGMAPAARWIGCRNMDRGNGTPTTYSECFQWFIAPTTIAGTNPDPSMAPHVINNSWSCPPSEGCTDPNVMLTVVNNVRAAGIVIVVSAGNSGSSCSSINTPAAIYESSFTVGAINHNTNNIVGFSSRGPVTVDGSNRLKPEISAPGQGIRSSVPGSGYASFSGTSMAGPHVAGMTGLILSAAPCMAGDVDAIEQHMIDVAEPRTTTQTCGGVPGSNVPNNTYGYGLLRSALPSATCSGLITLTSTGQWIPGGTVTLIATGANPGQELVFVSNLSGPGQGVCPPVLGGLCTDLREPFIVHGPAITNGSGVATKTITVPANATGNVYSQAFVIAFGNSKSTDILVVEAVQP